MKKLETFLLDSGFHTGAQIKNEVVRLLETIDQSVYMRMHCILLYMHSKFIDTENPIKDDLDYKISVNRLIFKIPMSEFLELDMNRYVKILRHREIDYCKIKCTAPKFFLDFMKFLKSCGVVLNSFAIIDYDSGERVLVTSTREIPKYIPLMSKLKDNFGIQDIPPNSHPTSILISKQMMWDELLDIERYPDCLREATLDCEMFNIEVYDPEQKYSYRR